MYATLEATPGLAAARRLADQRLISPDAIAGLPALVDQVCAEAGLWAPSVAARALAQSGGDIVRSVGLMRVWGAALPDYVANEIAAEDVQLVRRLSAAFAQIPGGQWLGPAPELASRLIRWDDDHPGDDRSVSDRPDGAGARSGTSAPASTGGPTSTCCDSQAPPTRAACERVRDMLGDAVIVSSSEDGPGRDPASVSIGPVISRATRAGVMSRGETASLVSQAALVLRHRREAVLAEVTAGYATVRVPHPRTRQPCSVVEVPIVEAEAVVDAEVDGHSALAIGWGASLGMIERRAIAIALIDGALQADSEANDEASLEQEILAVIDGSATNGFVEHLRLPHHASFASYLDQARPRKEQP